MIRKLAMWAAVAFVAYYLISDPHGAAGAVHGALAGLKHAGSSLSSFVSGL